MQDFRKLAAIILSAVLFFTPHGAFAGVDGSVVGTVTDSGQVAIQGASVKLLSQDGRILGETKTTITGSFDFFPVLFGSYAVVVEAEGFDRFSSVVSVTSSSASRVDATISRTGGREIVLNVREKRNLVQASSSGSKRDVSKEQIASQPMGSSVSLPKLIAQTVPGVVQGPFGQMFIRGNHANIQYQIDGVQLPESPGGTFADAFSARNIDHMEVITGGIPAEYGERLSAVLNIVTKTGAEKPGGELELNYGSYNTYNPQVNYGGSSESGRFHYFLAGSYLSTDRGLDTPQPASYTDQAHGGKDAVHDKATGNDQFARLEYQLDNSNKLSLNLFNSWRSFQIPNFPSSFKPTDPYFNPGFQDQFGNGTSDLTAAPTFRWSPSDTNDSQTEQNTYAQLIWKKTLSDRSFLTIAPYFKRSYINIGNDPAKDLATQANGTNPIANSSPNSFALNRTVDNLGLKTDYSLRTDDRNLIKSGFQVQQSSGKGSFSIQQDPTLAATNYQANDTGYSEAVYLQDGYSITKALTLNAGLRYSAIQFQSENLNTQDGLFQPRVGLEYLVTDTTKLHVFYGKLFQPAPFENLRKAFTTQGGGTATDYDVKSEKDDYYEAGVAQQIGETHLVTLNAYYKNAKDMLDDTQLLTTQIGQPYNFKEGYATGIEFSYLGQITTKWSAYLNYSYEDARGRGISGGSFSGATGSNDYQFLDHVQLNTSNAGMTYSMPNYWGTFQGVYGSGLRTGPANSLSLPSHITFDATIGYKFQSEDWWSKFKVSLDVINILDNAYPITINNGFNGSHYAPGRELFVRFAKEI